MLPSQKHFRMRKKIRRKERVRKELPVTPNQELEAAIALGSIYGMYKQYGRKDEIRELSEILKRSKERVKS
jgi:hypothetical protein